MRDVIDFRRWWVVLMPVAFAAMLIVSTRPAMSATSSVVVTMNVPSAITLTNGCTQQPAWGLGVVQPGSIATTATGANVCRFDFASSNDSAQLRIGQSDGTGTAMTGAPSVTNQGTTVDGHSRVSVGSATTAYVAQPLGVSTDTGGSWSSAGLPFGPSLIFGASSTLAYGITSGDQLSRSTDAGVNWVAITNPYAGMGDALVSPARGTNVIWVANGGNLSRSADQGATWTSQTAAISLAGVNDIRRIQTISTTDAVLLGRRADNSYAVWYTTDSGTSWTVNPVDPVGDYYSGHLSAVSTSVIWLRTGDSRVTRTANGGTSWTPIARVSASFGGDPWFIAIDANVALHSDGGLQFVRTTNAGSSWTHVVAPSNNAVASIDRFPGGQLVAAMARQTIMRSLDGGATWSIVKAGAPQMRSISAVNANAAFAAGANGTIRRTTDGTNWSTVETGTHPALWGVAASSSTSAIAVGDSGTVLRTINGTAWSVIPTGLPATTRLSGISGSGTSAIAVGTGGTIIRSSDAGLTWSAVTSGTSQHLWGVEHSKSDPNVIWVVGGADTVLRSTNGGATWGPVTPPGLGTEAVHEVSAVSPSIAWVTSRTDQVRRTIDGGATWTLWTAGGSVAYDIEAFDGQRAIATTYSHFARTSDGGATTTYINAGGYTGMLDALDFNTAWTTPFDREFAKLSPGASVPDFGIAPNNWTGGPADGLFAVCVQDIGLSGVINAPWVEDTTSTPGSCQAVVADPWAAIPTTSSKLATTASAGQAGRVDLVWAMRAPNSQAPGDYSATITIEALAPNA